MRESRLSCFGPTATVVSAEQASLLFNVSHNPARHSTSLPTNHRIVQPTNARPNKTDNQAPNTHTHTHKHSNLASNSSTFPPTLRINATTTPSTHPNHLNHPPNHFHHPNPSPQSHIPHSQPTFPTVTSRTHTRSNNNDDNNDKRTTTMTTMTTTTTTMAIAVRSVAACSTQRPSLPPSQLTHSLVPSQLTSITHSLILTLTHLVSSIAVNLHLLGSDKTSRCYYNGSGQWKTFCRIVGYVAVQALDATRDVSMNGNIKNGK